MSEIKRASWYGTEDKIDVYEFCRQHDLNPIESAIIKYIVRWRKKGGGWTKSIQKAKFLLERLCKEGEDGLHGVNPNIDDSSIPIFKDCVFGHDERQEEIFQLKEALLLCQRAAGGDRYAWEGSAYNLPDPGGTRLDDRVNRICEIVNKILGNTSVVYQEITDYRKTFPK